MKDEISVAVQFLSNVIERNMGGGVDEKTLEIFRNRLSELLCERFQNHWFPEKPSRGQGYRCIRVNEASLKESLITRAASNAGLSYEQLSLPPELTIWVDPKEVCCRFGERQGSFCQLATFKNGTVETHFDQVNYEEIQKKLREQWEKMKIEISTRKNGNHRPRSFLSTSGTGSSPNFKGGRSYISTNGYSSGHPNHHHSHSNGHGGHSHHHNSHSHQGGHNGGGGLHHSSTHTPSPAAVSWFNSVNSTNNAAPSEMFSSSPPNHFAMYGLAKFSPPKYGYGSPSKWNPAPPPHPTTYGSPIPPGKGDKYHWFSNNKASIKA